MEREQEFLADAPAASVYRQYAAARQVEAALCCPVDFFSDLLAAIPAEVIERDYGCGTPDP
ncbi:MAG: hypothetical protein KDB03_21845 [Planctomycetales bacterium]|nr:hypothetical protein [Planctomycetales bacterium]